MVKPTVISTFSGCGGSSLGYQMAGFHELLAVESDQNAVDTFRLNFPDVPVYHGDIAKLTGSECMRLARIENGDLDVLDGSPPCQGFSTAGKRKFDDPRNSLFKEYARLLSELQPKVFVMENVTGMVKGYMKQAYLQIIKTLRECGYKAKGEVMNAMYYNVPQSRERVIIIGVREDLGIEPSHPKPQGKPITVRQALVGINNEQYELDWCNHIQQSIIYPRICKMKPGDNYADYSPTGSGFTLSKNWIDRPSCTITKTVNHAASSDGTLHPLENRKHTITEIKRLSSFPDNFQTVGDFRERWARIGNSVPPNLMKAIAEHINVGILQRMKDAFPELEIKNCNTETNL